MELKGKVALVTGAGAGIGRGCAVELARAGAVVVVNDINQARLDDVRKYIELLGGLCRTLTRNMFEEIDRMSLVDSTITEFGGIDILVTGPASTVHGYVPDLDPIGFMRVVNANLISQCHVASLVARNVIDRKVPGRIIFISSIYGSEVRKKSLPYDTSKAALNHAAKIFARELGQYGILVNAIAPGFTDTPGERVYMNDAKVKEVSDGLLLRKAGTPKDIGETAVFLAQSDYVTGQILTVAGGMDLIDYTYDKKEAR